MGKAPAQASFPATVVEVGDKAGGIIAVRGEVLAKRGVSLSSGESQPAVNSWGHLAVNMLPCDGRVHGAVANAWSNRTPCLASCSRLGEVFRP